jgi:dihydroorotase (multifunctional complex type)
VSIDLRIHGGIIQSARESLDADLVISDGKVVGLVGRDMPVDAAETVDATGKWVLPGMVDMHVHSRVPGYEYKEDFRTASRAAAVGGVTTYVDMPNVEPPTETVELFEAKRQIAERDSHVDWGHWVAPTKLDQIPLLAEAGATGFKIFQVGGGYPHDPRLVLSDPGRVYATFEQVASTGLPCLVHAFAQTLLETISEQAWAAGQPRDVKTFSSIYTRDIVWSAAVSQLLELSRETGARLHLLHTHAGASLRLLRRAKEDGHHVTVGIDPKYFHLTARDLAESGARGMPGGFIVENEERLAEIWRSLDDGTIDVIDSDHAPHTLDDLKRAEADPWTGPWGGPHLEHMLSLLLTDVRAGKLRLGRLIELISENPARIIGVYPRKGALLPGSDADVVIVDPEADVVPQDEGMESKSAWTPYAGWNLIGAPVRTILRGQTVALDGRVTGQPGYGSYISGTAQEPAPPVRGQSPGLAFARR